MEIDGARLFAVLRRDRECPFSREISRPGCLSRYGIWGKKNGGGREAGQGAHRQESFGSGRSLTPSALDWLQLAVRLHRSTSRQVDERITVREMRSIRLI